MVWVWVAIACIAIACAANTTAVLMILRALTRAHETWQEGVE
jgi:hypothetical protein